MAGILLIHLSFAEKTEAIRKAIKSESGKVRFTYLGYLVPRKNVQLLLESVKIVAAQRRDFVLDVLGDGISSDSLKNLLVITNLKMLLFFMASNKKQKYRHSLLKAADYYSRPISISGDLY
ncbi:MAG: glycosyltransferase [Bacteroidetes bacterium]|nr:glycosyltransferase [Bacteroidota bacterium]